MRRSKYWGDIMPCFVQMMVVSGKRGKSSLSHPSDVVQLRMKPELGKGYHMADLHIYHVVEGAFSHLFPLQMVVRHSTNYFQRLSDGLHSTSNCSTNLTLSMRPRLWLITIMLKWQVQQCCTSAWTRENLSAGWVTYIWITIKMLHLFYRQFSTPLWSGGGAFYANDPL